MRNRTKVALINLSAGFLWLAAFVLLCLYAIFSLKANVYFAAGISALGLVLNYYLFAFFHEAGHVVFSKKTALKPEKVNFGLITVEFAGDKSAQNKSAGVSVNGKTGKKTKIKFAPFSREAGVSEFSAVKEVSLNDLKKTAMGGLVFSFIYCAAAFFVLLFVKNATVFCLFGAGACSAYYVFTVNVLPFDKTNDGSLVLFDGYCGSLADMLEFSRLTQNYSMNNDEKIKNLAILSQNKLSFAFNAYIAYETGCFYGEKCENGGDEKTENNETAKLSVFDCFSGEKALDKLSDEEYFLIFPELVFSCCVNANKKPPESGDFKGDKSEKYVKFLNGNEALITNFFSCGETEKLMLSQDFSCLKILRAHSAYRFFMGEKEWGETLENSYKKTLEKFASSEKSNGETENFFYLKAEKTKAGILSGLYRA